MINILTDSLYHFMRNKDFICKQELFKWSLKADKNEYSLIKKDLDKTVSKKLMDSEVIAIISPSNYKLLYDIKELNVKKIYAPEFYEKKKTMKVDFKKIEIEFEKFLKRSYLSYLNYENLQNLGLNRVEQFIIIMNFALFNHYKNLDNMTLQEGTYEVIKIEKTKDIILSSKRISFIKCLRLMNAKYNMSFEEASKFLLQQYSHLKISDVFSEEGFIPLQKIELDGFNQALFDILKNEYKAEEFKLTLKIKNKTKVIFIKKLIGENKNVSNYYGLQENYYSEGNTLEFNQRKYNIELIYDVLKKILPLKDFLLTIKSMIKLEKLKEENGFLFVDSELVTKLNINYNKDWISPLIWNSIYEHQDYDFFNILDEIESTQIEFECPVCKNKNYETTPTKFFCKSYDCGFSFYRNSLKHLNVKAINASKFKEAMIHKKIFIKNNDGKNYTAFLKNRKGFYFLSLN